MAKRKLGEIVRELREARAMSPIELAERAQLALGYVTLLEAGQQANPPLSIITRLARALTVPVKRLTDPED